MRVATVRRLARRFHFGPHAAPLSARPPRIHSPSLRITEFCCFVLRSARLVFPPSPDPVTDEARLPSDPVLGFATVECGILGRALLVAPPRNRRRRYHMHNLYFVLFFLLLLFYIVHFTNIKTQRTASAGHGYPGCKQASPPGCSCFSVSLTPFCSAESATCQPFEK